MTAGTDGKRAGDGMREFQSHMNGRQAHQMFRPDVSRGPFLAIIFEC
jgi:hypothetical protein